MGKILMTSEVAAELGCTELHSSDDSLFTLVFPEATDRRQVAGVEPVAVGVGL